MGAEVQTWTGRVRKAMRAMGARRGRLSAPWPRFHGVDRADVYIIIHVRACCCGECELNPPPSPPIPRRRSSLTPPHSDTPFPSTSAPPRSPDARPQAARCIPRRPYHPFPAEGLRLPPRTATRPRRALPLAHAVPTHARRLRDARPPTSQPTPRRRPPLAPAQRHALPEHFRSPTQPRRTPTQSRTAPAGCAMHARRPHNPFPAAPRCLPFCSASGTKKRHRTASVRCRMFRSTVVAVGHLGW